MAPDTAATDDDDFAPYVEVAGRDFTWPVLRTPRVWEGWPDDLAGILREAAKRLEQAPWLKPIEGMRLWADALDYERQIREAEVRNAD